MAELKTKPNKQSVKKFIEGIKDEKARRNCRTILKLMKEVTKLTPKMWTGNMVGFGSYHYKYASGREGDWFLTGFSPRKQNLTLYIMSGFDRYGTLMKKLGKCKTSVSCLYVKDLNDIHMPTLKTLIRESVRHMRKLYP